MKVLAFVGMLFLSVAVFAGSARPPVTESTGREVRLNPEGCKTLAQFAHNIVLAKQKYPDVEEAVAEFNLVLGRNSWDEQVAFATKNMVAFPEGSTAVDDYYAFHKQVIRILFAAKAVTDPQEAAEKTLEQCVGQRGEFHMLEVI